MGDLYVSVGTSSEKDIGEALKARSDGAAGSILRNCQAMLLLEREWRRIAGNAADHTWPHEVCGKTLVIGSDRPGADFDLKFKINTIINIIRSKLLLDIERAEVREVDRRPYRAAVTNARRSSSRQQAPLTDAQIEAEERAILAECPDIGGELLRAIARCSARARHR